MNKANLIEAISRLLDEHYDDVAPVCPARFYKEATGGGCTAWARYFGALNEYCVSITEDASVPEAFPVYIGVYEEGDPVKEWESVTADNYVAVVEEACAFAEKASASVYHYFYKVVGVHSSDESLIDCPLDSVVGSAAKDAIDTHMRVIHQHEETMGCMEDTLREALVDGLDKLVQVLWRG